jgi:flagellar FliL protein
MATAQPTIDAAPKKGRSKKLLIIVLASVLVLGAAGGGALFYIKKKQAAEMEAEGEEFAEEGSTAKAKAKGSRRDLAVKPVFVPLDLFTVNLADRDADRYAQVTITLELRDEKSAEMVKNHMPVIRNYILMTLSYKTAAELLERDGKKRLAQELNREIARALGLQVAEEPGAAPAAAPAGEDGAPPPRRKPKLKPEEISPVIGVHFFNFIIQ